jgi:hypothetical protein
MSGKVILEGESPFELGRLLDASAIEIGGDVVLTMLVENPATGGTSQLLVPMSFAVAVALTGRLNEAAILAARENPR